jgi:SAM-dependent methyltransferase
MNTNQHQELASVKAYRTKGKFPRMHNDLYHLIAGQIEIIDRSAFAGDVFDLGCGNGLLMARLARRFAYVTGFERNIRRVNTANSLGVGNMKAIAMKVTIETLNPFLYMAEPSVIVARRSLPEISGGNPSIIRRMAEDFHKVGVKFIAIEGMTEGEDERHPLNDILKECEMFSGFFDMAVRHRNCALLERV